MYLPYIAVDGSSFNFELIPTEVKVHYLLRCELWQPRIFPE